MISSAPQRRGGRWRLRDWRLRTTLTAVLLVPLVLAGVLGAVRVTELVREARDIAALRQQVGFAQNVRLVVHDLQDERRLAAAMLVTGRAPDGTALQAQIQRVDAAVSILRTVDIGAHTRQEAAAGSQLAPAHRAAFDRLSGLAAVRQAPAGPNAGVRNSFTAYSDLITALLELDRRVLDRTVLGGARDPQAAGLTALAVAKEQVSRQHAVLLTGILSGALPADQQAVLRTAQARFDAAVDEFGEAVPPSQRGRYSSTGAAADRTRLLDAALDRAARQLAPEAVADDWNAAAVATAESLRQGETTLLNELRTDTAARGDRAWSEALWEGIAIAALLLLAVLTLVVVVRSLARPLRTAAFGVADRQLPAAVEQLSSTDGTAGRNDIVRDLSGRNQGLVERQLQLIDELRSRHSDPDLLSSLVQLDHLAARMRRHSASLLVLAGGNPGGGVVPGAAVLDVLLLDVLRRATSEIEEYQRVTMRRSPAAMVAGPVVTDLVHLIAELLDNATRAAPQETTVELAGELTADEGLLVEILDSGPGLRPGELQAINGRLASPPAVDAAVSGPVGLHVVSALAAEHGITVRLRRRLSGIGTTTTVLLPPSLVSVGPRVPVGPPASIDTASEVTASTEWGGTDGQLPLQVSVIDEATAADLFSPASIGIVSSQPSRPRTAEEDWQELFGYQTPQPESAPLDPVANSVPPADGKPPEVREEIFEMVSAWFREWQAAPVGNDQLDATTEMPVVPGPAWTAAGPPPGNAHEWRSPLDEGWQAAQALRTPVDHGVTVAGLPKRRPRSQLVPGADGASRPGSTTAPAGPARTPDEVRGRLSRYQRGLRVGRHARVGPDEQLTMTDIPRGRFEEDQQ